MTIGALTTVEAIFSPEGEITPRSFTWRGTRLPIEGVGRRWTEKGKRCFTVIAVGRLFELRLDEGSFCWRVTRASGPGMAV
jgi:hypothetical protein